MLNGSVCPRLLTSRVFVVGAAGCLGLFPLQRFPELAFGVVFRCFSHVRSVARAAPAVVCFYRLPGGMPYIWEIGNVIITRRSSTIARR